LAENLLVNPGTNQEGTDHMAAYTRDDVEKMAEALRSLPAATKTRLSKQGVIAHLAAEILGLQERGYTIEQIAERLQVLGLVITTKTLSTYLGRVKKRVRRRRRKASGPLVLSRQTAQRWAGRSKQVN
jgi:hypothetical protein